MIIPPDPFNDDYVDPDLYDPDDPPAPTTAPIPAWPAPDTDPDPIQRYLATQAVIKSGRVPPGWLPFGCPHCGQVHHCDPQTMHRLESPYALVRWHVPIACETCSRWFQWSTERGKGVSRKTEPYSDFDYRARAAYHKALERECREYHRIVELPPPPPPGPQQPTEAERRELARRHEEAFQRVLADALRHREMTEQVAGYDAGRLTRDQLGPDAQRFVADREQQPSAARRPGPADPPDEPVWREDYGNG